MTFKFWSDTDTF